MGPSHKEHRNLLYYALAFFALLTISSLMLLKQIQATNQSSDDFFEPIQFELTNPGSLFN